MAVVSALYIYPIKSCRGVRVSEWPVVARGFAADRRWMIVDANGKFVTQREIAQLALVSVALEAEQLRLSAPGRPELTLPLRYESGESREVQVWQDRALAIAHALGGAWFSDFLGAPHELVYMPEHHRRPVNPARAKPGDIVSFADAYPFLVISEASLAELNSRLEVPITMERFRPNIVISESQPFAEDGYAQVRMGEISFRGPKRCERCVVTTIDPSTGERGKEPLRTLAQFRLADQKIWFG
ncbi:MAG TPA: MOSC N-terminal beta barrel domain-containing protein, partial [Polyangiaceae bacterium]